MLRTFQTFFVCAESELFEHPNKSNMSLDACKFEEVAIKTEGADKL